MLAALSGVAERTGAAIIVVMHLNKADSNTAMYRVGGSIAYVGSARWLFWSSQTRKTRPEGDACFAA